MSGSSLLDLVFGVFECRSSLVDCVFGGLESRCSRVDGIFAVWVVESVWRI